MQIQQRIWIALYTIAVFICGVLFTFSSILKLPVITGQTGILIRDAAPEHYAPIGVPEVDNVTNTCNCAVESRSEKSQRGATVDVVVSLDKKYFAQVVVMMNAILKNTKSAVHFHVVAHEIDPSIVRRYVQCFQLPPHNLEVVPFESDLVNDVFGPKYKKYKKYGTKAVQKDSNYVRILLHRLFPKLSRALYLDIDIIVQGDILELWNLLSDSKKLISTVSRNPKTFGRTYGDYFNKNLQKAFKDHYQIEMNVNRSTFVNGVYMANFNKWRKMEKSINEDVQFWMEGNIKKHWWKHGSNLLYFLVFYDEWEENAPYEWELEHLEKKIWKKKDVENGKLLHFMTIYKPWNTKHRFGDFWKRQKPERCN